MRKESDFEQNDTHDEFAAEFAVVNKKILEMQQNYTAEKAAYDVQKAEYQKSIALQVVAENAVAMQALAVRQERVETAVGAHVEKLLKSNIALSSEIQKECERLTAKSHKEVELVSAHAMREFSKIITSTNDDLKSMLNSAQSDVTIATNSIKSSCNSVDVVVRNWTWFKAANIIYKFTIFVILALIFYKIR